MESQRGKVSHGVAYFNSFFLMMAKKAVSDFRAVDDAEILLSFGEEGVSSRRD